MQLLKKKERKIKSVGYLHEILKGQISLNDAFRAIPECKANNTVQNELRESIRNASKVDQLHPGAADRRLQKKKERISISICKIDVS